MLRVLCGEAPKYLLDTAVTLFNIEHRNDWFNDPLVEEMIKDIDKTDHIADAVFKSPVLGTIPATSLSGGVKGLILILKSKQLNDYDAMRSCIFGNNCVKWLIKLSYLADFTIYMSHYLNFYYGGNYSKDFDGYHNTPVNAVGRDNEPLSTCGELMRYFEDNDTYENKCYPLQREIENARLMKSLKQCEDPAYLKYIHENHPYVIPMNDPYSIAYSKLAVKLDEAKTEEERAEIFKQMDELRRERLRKQRGN